MAKPQKQQNAPRSSKSAPAKSPGAKFPAAKAPAAKVAAGKLPPAGSRLTKSPVTKAAAAKLPAPKPGPAKLPAKKPEAAKLPAVKTAAAKSKKDSPAIEQSPATEAQIVEALAGKLTARSGGAGFSWLGTSSSPKTEESKKEEPKASAPEAPPKAPPPVIAVVETVIIEEVPPETLPANEVTILVIEPQAPAEEPAIAPSAAAEVKRETIKVEVPAIEELNVAVAMEAQRAAAGDAGNPPPKEWIPQAAANERSLGKMLKQAGDRIGWTLTVQAGLLVAFCILLPKDAPRTGMVQIMLGGIPLFAMVLICVGLANCHATQLLLDKLEAERLEFQRLGAGTEMPPDSFSNARRLACWPSLIILGILLVVWLCLGLTVWFL